MSFNEGDRTVRYFATSNLRAPFVAAFGDWPDRSGLVRNSLRNGVKFGQRPMIECELEWLAESTRHMFMYWPSIREMLWTHKSPDLIHFYPILLAYLREKRYPISIKRRVLERKRQIKANKELAMKAVIEQNKSRLPTNTYVFEHVITTDTDIMTIDERLKYLADTLPDINNHDGYANVA